ncbi:MAG: hypothetical protein M1819_006724 [Sarea resinae]|nr:MAG: hypothetical protein M1819_006724 [Sarea resinae]
MPRNAKVYGKRSTAAAYVSPTFANLSSPTKPAPKHVEVKVKALGSSQGKPRRDNDEDALVQNLENLDLGHEDTKETPPVSDNKEDATKQEDPRKGVLGPKNHNEQIPPTKKHNKKKTIEEQAPRQEDGLGVAAVCQSPVRRERRARRTKREEPPLLTLDALTAHTQPLLDLSSDPADSTGPLEFQVWADEIAQNFTVDKIAEASYGEVYRLKFSDPKSGWDVSDESVLKIIALKPPEDGVPQSSKNKKKNNKVAAFMSEVADVVSEVELLRRMSPVPGFTNFREVRVIRGRPATQFVDAWKRFRRERKKSHFPDPSKAFNYGEDQLWAIIEMQDAGTDLENLAFGDVFWKWDVFWGVAMALAKGEELAGFEHRDLHLGNICIQSRKQNDDSSEMPGPLADGLEGKKYNFTGTRTTLIDYTLSRAEMEDTVVRADGEEERRIAYLDLERDCGLYEGEGEYQYDIYRYMRADLFWQDPYNEAGGYEELPETTIRSWRDYHPRSNLLWLHYILYKLLEKEEDTKTVTSVDDLYQSVQERLKEHLKRLETILEPRQTEMQSASDLIALAIGEGWLDEGDVIGAGEGTQLESSSSLL